MKRPLLVITSTLLLFFLSMAERPAAKPVKLLNDYCELYGQVYLEENTGFIADYKVYIEESEAFANMLVFEEETSSFANEPGYWYFTDVPGFADFKIQVVSSPAFADFTIAFTDFRTSAGCR